MKRYLTIIIFIQVLALCGLGYLMFNNSVQNEDDTSVTAERGGTFDIGGEKVTDFQPNVNDPELVPTPVKITQPIIDLPGPGESFACPDDVYTCPDGTQVQRSPQYSCFFLCQGTETNQNAYFLVTNQRGQTLEFPSNDIISSCSPWYKRCENGRYVVADNQCSFNCESSNLSNSDINTDNENETQLEITGSQVNSLCPVDYNNDKEVELNDFSIFTKNYRNTLQDCSLDLAGNDCRYNLNDLAIYARYHRNYERCVNENS